MTGFAVHPRLLEDCHSLGRLSLCHVLLHRRAAVPWFILVPEVGPGTVELHQLDEPCRRSLDTELDLVARYVEARFDVTKLNVAAIGNVVRQLHVHVIGRRSDDPCWPGVVWGRDPAGEPWTQQAVQALKRDLAGLGLR
jgi:diadenosine tetraphosphate (Ap4A) HIT family hydrolase